MDLPKESHHLQKICSGKIQLLVGTHAVITEKVEFSNLGLVITDEQHRFGVKQRETLEQKEFIRTTLL
ncbi:MAG: DEAD/DEAH box helicase [Lachnospiraceae bacterium]